MHFLFSPVHPPSSSSRFSLFSLLLFSENDSLDRIHFLVLVIQRAGFYTHKGIASSSRFVLSNRPRMTSVGHLIHLPVPAANDVSRRVMQAWCDSQGRAASCRPDVTHRGGRSGNSWRTTLVHNLPTHHRNTPSLAITHSHLTYTLWA